MQSSAIRTMQPNWVAPHHGPWLARFFGKLVLDILPAALASVIGGFLLRNIISSMLRSRSWSTSSRPRPK